VLLYSGHNDVMLMICGDDVILAVAETERRVKANQRQFNATFNYAVSRRWFFLSFAPAHIAPIQTFWRMRLHSDR